MIIPNGTIEILSTSGGGLDSTTGYPVAPSESWGTPVECQISVLKFNAQALAMNNPVTQRSYAVLIESESMVSMEKVRLKRTDGTLLGVFPVISVEPVESVGQLKITV